MWHLLGQGVFIRLVAAPCRLVGVNVLEANGILLVLSCLGNEVAGSRMRRVEDTGAAEVHIYIYIYRVLRLCVCLCVFSRKKTLSGSSATGFRATWEAWKISQFFFCGLALRYVAAKLRP